MIIIIRGSANKMLSIKDVMTNRRYKIKQINIHNRNMQHRLSALGLHTGSVIKLKQKCLLHGPCIIEIEGQQISIRHCDACHIVLEG